MRFSSTAHPGQPSPRSSFHNTPRPCFSAESEEECVHTHTHPLPLRNGQPPNIHFVRWWVFVISYKSEFEQPTSDKMLLYFFHPVDKRSPAFSCICFISCPLDKAHLLPVTLLHYTVPPTACRTPPKAATPKTQLTLDSAQSSPAHPAGSPRWDAHLRSHGHHFALAFLL